MGGLEIEAEDAAEISGNCKLDRLSSALGGSLPMLAFIYQTNIHKIGDDVAYCGFVQLQSAGDVDTTEAALLPDKLGHKGGVCITLEDIVACRHLSHPFLVSFFIEQTDLNIGKSICQQTISFFYIPPHF